MTIPARAVTVWRLDEGTATLRVIHASGSGASRLNGVEVPLDDRPVAWAVRHRRTVVGHDHLAPRRGSRRHGPCSDLEACHDDAALRALSSSLVVPIVSGGTALGALALYDEDDRKFTREDRRWLSGAAGYVARAMERSPGGKGESHTPTGTLTDPLTGLPNARFLWLEVAQRTAVTERSGRLVGAPYGIVAFRVGHLSEVVTRYGAEVAERGLTQIARRLAGACTTLETLVRFGHDLFVVLSPTGRTGPIVDRWHHLVDAVESRPLDLPSETDVRLRLVAAHASYPADGDDLDALLDVLEARLDQGRDDRRTVVPFHRPERAPSAETPAAGEQPV